MSKKLVETVGALGARHLVIGHQPGKTTFADGTVRKAGEIFCYDEGLFFMIDTGMSRGVTGALALCYKYVSVQIISPPLQLVVRDNPDFYGNIKYRQCHRPYSRIAYQFCKFKIVNLLAWSNANSSSVAESASTLDGL